MSSVSKAQKIWVPVRAPSAFNQVELPRIMAQSTESILNRRITVSLSDITGDLRQVQVFLKFRIIDVTGGVAKTRFDQLELAREFVRGISRRSTTKTELVSDVETKDGARLRIFIVAVTRGKIHRSKRTAIRKTGQQILETKASQTSFDQFTQEIVLGKAAAEIFAAARKIAGINTLEIRKVKVLSPPLPQTAEEQV
jgi:small subunit ribosomal protein S3Ae